MEIWELTAREAVRDLVARYNANGDRGRFDAVLELFAPHADMEVLGVLHEGIEGISAMFSGAQADVKALPASGERTYIRHFTATLQIDVVDEDHARSHCYFQVLQPHGLDHWGRYQDEYERIDGRWLFSRRKVSMDGYLPGGLGEAAAKG
jgi:hypothetical protein